jgi:hypothetical protein
LNETKGPPEGAAFLLGKARRRRLKIKTEKTTPCTVAIPLARNDISDSAKKF